MRRILPAIAAFALVIAGVGTAVAVLAARDHSGLQTTTPTAASTGPAGLPAGNVVVDFTDRADGRTIDALAARLGADDSPATRAAGQALVSHKVRSGEGVAARTGALALVLPSAADPRLADFARQHLGRTDGS